MSLFADFIFLETKIMLRFVFSVWTALIGSGVAAADETAVRGSIDRYVQSFNAKDAASVGMMWTDDAQYLDLTAGTDLQGRQAISKMLSEALTGDAPPSLSVSVESVRMLGEGAARVEGTNEIGFPEQPPQTFQFVALLVRQGDEWLINSIEETLLGVQASPADVLQSIAWLEGTWRDETDDADVVTQVRWLPGKNFLVRTFRGEIPGESLRVGFQIIGVDPMTAQVRSWSFFDDGSFGEGSWTIDDEMISVNSTQTLPDGAVASSTYIVRRIDGDSLQVKMIGRSAGGVPLPNTEPVMVRRTTDASQVVEGDKP